MELRDKIEQVIFEDYLSGFHFDVPDLEDNDPLKAALIRESKKHKDSKLHLAIKNWILDGVRRETMFKTQNDKETSYQRGIARGIQMYDEYMIKFSVLEAKKN